jgi:hypothetical protein
MQQKTDRTSILMTEILKAEPTEAVVGEVDICDFIGSAL